MVRMNTTPDPLLEQHRALTRLPLSLRNARELGGIVLKDGRKIKRGLFANEIIYARGMTDEQIRQYNENRPKEDDTEAELIIDFYNRFIYRMEYMMKVGKENGYDLISFMGP